MQEHKKLKVMTLLGIRPDIIRLARVIALLEKHTEHVLVHTGQNYDYELNQVFFEDLGIKKPDYFMGINTTTLGKSLGDTLIKTEEILLKEQPDALLILGDPNSSIACVIAKRLKIPLYHMEAGNRSFDLNVPEELNRKIIDHMSDINLVYTETARRNLLREGLHSRYIYLTGSPMKEVIDYYMKDIEKSTILEKLSLQEKKYFTVSFHREQNVDNSDNLRKILTTLNAVAEKYNMPLIVSMHPRTKKRMKHLKDVVIDKKIQFLKPFGFLDYIKLQKYAYCVISDSGSISEESAMLSFPAITVRDAIERAEAMDSGNIMITGLDQDTIFTGIELVTSREPSKQIPYEYTITNTSERVAKIILGTARLVHKWTGAVKNDLTYK